MALHPAPWPRAYPAQQCTRHETRIPRRRRPRGHPPGNGSSPRQPPQQRLPRCSQAGSVRTGGCEPFRRRISSRGCGRFPAPCEPDRDAPWLSGADSSSPAPPSFSRCRWRSQNESSAPARRPGAPRDGALPASQGARPDIEQSVSTRKGLAQAAPRDEG